MKAIQLKHSDKHVSYDSVYEFIQKYPEWDKLVFYDENLENFCDELLTIHINPNIPLEFNRINWQKVDQKIDKIYEILLNQEKKTVPSILFINSQDIRRVLSEHYEIITTKMWEYYINKRLEKENPTFNEYNNNQKYNTYDGFYYFIKDYPELSDIVFFDPDK